MPSAGHTTRKGPHRSPHRSAWASASSQNGGHGRGICRCTTPIEPARLAGQGPEHRGVTTRSASHGQSQSDGRTRASAAVAASTRATSEQGSIHDDGTRGGVPTGSVFVAAAMRHGSEQSCNTVPSGCSTSGHGSGAPSPGWAMRNMAAPAVPDVAASETRDAIATTTSAETTKASMDVCVLMVGTRSNHPPWSATYPIFGPRSPGLPDGFAVLDDVGKRRVGLGECGEIVEWVGP